MAVTVMTTTSTISICGTSFRSFQATRGNIYFQFACLVPSTSAIWIHQQYQISKHPPLKPTHFNNLDILNHLHHHHYHLYDKYFLINLFVKRLHTPSACNKNLVHPLCWDMIVCVFVCVIFNPMLAYSGAVWQFDSCGNPCCSPLRGNPLKLDKIWNWLQKLLRFMAQAQHI